MSLSIECLECEYTGKVSPAKAGKTIPCPSCSEPIEVPTGKSKPKAAGRSTGRSTGSSGRQTTTDNSIGMIALLGSTVLLVGILVMYWIKTNQLQEDENLSQSPGVEQTTGNGDPGVSIPSSDNESTPVDVGGDKLPDDSSTNSVKAGDNSTGSVNQASLATTTEPESSAEITLPEIKAVSPEVALLAGITEVVFELNSFAEDSRGAVQNAIQANAVAELNKCRLKCVEDESKPVLVIDLDLRQVGGIQKLGMKAQLQAEMLGVQVVAWENDAALVAIDQKALTNGIALPGLDRQVSQFFLSLRDKIETSKTAINSINEINRRKNAAKDLINESDLNSSN